jgi:hypothetical protein
MVLMWIAQAMLALRQHGCRTPYRNRTIPDDILNLHQAAPTNPTPICYTTRIHAHQLNNSTI